MRLHRFIQPCLPSIAKQPPSGTGWLYEIKFDGYRLMARRDAQGTVLFTKTGVNWTRLFHEVAGAVEALSCRSCLIDGEIVACDDNGLPSFELLRKRQRATTAIAFDLIELDGVDLRPEPIEHRRVLLQTLIKGASPHLVFSHDFDAPPATLFERVCAFGLEGIVCKRKGSRYRSGRSKHWIKLKNPNSAAVVREASENWGKKRR